MQLLRELPGRSLLPRLTLPSPVKGANRKLGSTFEACSHFFARLLLGVIGRGWHLGAGGCKCRFYFFVAQRWIQSTDVQCQANLGHLVTTTGAQFSRSWRNCVDEIRSVGRGEC